MDEDELQCIEAALRLLRAELALLHPIVRECRELAQEYGALVRQVKAMLPSV
jgi:hypothetical protein